MTLTRTDNPEEIKSFLKGDGIRKLASGSAYRQTSNSDIDRTVKDNSNVLLMVEDSGIKLGWIAFLYSGVQGMYAIHVCLKTLGNKTKQAIQKAINYIKLFGASEIIAVYPKTRESLNRLTDVLGFKLDVDSLDRFSYPAFEELIGKKLTLRN